jgi:hypothetical protein
MKKINSNDKVMLLKAIKNVHAVRETIIQKLSSNPSTTIAHVGRLELLGSDLVELEVMLEIIEVNEAEAEAIAAKAKAQQLEDINVAARKAAAADNDKPKPAKAKATK